MSNKKNNIMDDISSMASSTVTTMVNMKKDIANIVAEQIKAFMERMDFVTKSEFDALKKTVQSLSENSESKRPARSFSPSRGAPRRGDSQRFDRDGRSGSRSFGGARSGSRSESGSRGESRFDRDRPERDRSERGDSRFDRDRPARDRSDRGESRFDRDRPERSTSQPRKSGTGRPFAKKSDFDSRSENRSEKRRPKLSAKPRRSAEG